MWLMEGHVAPEKEPVTKTAKKKTKKTQRKNYSIFLQTNIQTISVTEVASNGCI